MGIMSRLSDQLLNKVRPELWPVANLGILKLSATHLENHLSSKLGGLTGDDKQSI